MRYQAIYTAAERVQEGTGTFWFNPPTLKIVDAQSTVLATLAIGERFAVGDTTIEFTPDIVASFEFEA